MLLPRTIVTALALVALPFATAAAQSPDTARLVVQHDTVAPRTLTAATLRMLPRRTVTATAHGETHRYAGVALADLLAHAGAWPAGDRVAGSAGARGNLRGAGLARFVVVTGADGYRAVLALAELDTSTVAPAAGGPVLVADTMDDHPLPATDGPFRLVVPGDLRPARSVRQVVRLEVRAAP